MVPQFHAVHSQIMWHTGDLYVANKELNADGTRLSDGLDNYE